jgi:phage nucleotide-binding protein
MPTKTSSSDTVKKSQATEVTNPIKMLVYAPPGYGKTYLAGTAVGDKRLMPMVLADFEGGVRSIKSKVVQVTTDDFKTHRPSIDKITVLRIKRWADFDVLYEVLDSPDNPYKSLFIDSLSELNYQNLQENVAVAARGDRGHDPDVPERQDYLRSGVQMRKLIRVFRDLEMHTIFTAQAADKENPQTKRQQAVPNLTGKLSAEIPGLVDIVGYLGIVDDEDESGEPVSYRSLLVQPTGRFMAKARDEEGRLGDAVDRPTLPKILDLLDG